ncbi:MAG: RHS repeat-associated core domain-containing protein, partial [Candidatus Angelobacter sp.]
YTPDSAGRVLSAIDSGNSINYATAATYGPDSSLTGFVSGSGGAASITSSFSYNKRLQPVTMSAATSSQTVFSIGYDFHVGNGDNGNVFGITNYKDQNRNQTFTYDALNRLTSAQNAGTDCNVKVLQNKTEYWGNNYSYDAWGNLQGKSVTKCSAENAVFTMNNNNQALYYPYDAAGNMLNDGLFSYTFDQENRITGANGYTYTYDGDGNRVKKINGSTGTLYWYMTPGIVGESDLSGNLQSEYVFFDGERVARKDFPGNAVSYYFSDHLKTASVITDSAGNIKSESDYYPWGGELQITANDSNHYKFTGKERDAESGLDNFGARYYSNGLGRWVSADWSATPVPVPYADFGDPQSLNQYTYVRNIPTTRFDADGHDGGTAAAVWELFAGGVDVSAGMWTVGSVALPGMLGGGLAYGAINSTANNYDTVANAEMQYQVLLNNLAVQINEMARAGKSTEQLRKEWEKLTGQKWPQDPTTGANQDAHHTDPLADGGADVAEKIQPMPHPDHVDHHKKKGDFKRWGKRAHQKPKPKPPAPTPEPPKPDPPKTEPTK